MVSFAVDARVESASAHEKQAVECRMITSPRPRIRSALLLATALLAASRLAPPTRAASGIDGLWDASVVANGVEIPFRFEIATNGREAQGFFFEGDRKIGSTSRPLSRGGPHPQYS